MGIYLQNKSLISFTWAALHMDSVLNDSLYRIDLSFPTGADRDPQSYGEVNGKNNYYLGSVTAESVAGFHRVYYEDIWPDIDLHFHHGTSGPRMSFAIDPGGDPDDVRLSFNGQDSMKVDWQGHLKIYLEDKWIEFEEAVAYQVDSIGTVLPVNWTASYFHESGSVVVKFNFDYYDVTKPLLLQIGYPPMPALGGGDPRNMGWSTYVGGSFGDELKSVEVDENGDPYTCGYSWSLDFPVDPGNNFYEPFVDAPPGDCNAVVMKFDASNKQLIWAT
ncbi:MAG: hypothetical protein KDC00_11405, partial [Flavobacteriales bacterium]|nr:hypothetical protein [Flavobacteriales bacterium]